LTHAAQTAMLNARVTENALFRQTAGPALRDRIPGPNGMLYEPTSPNQDQKIFCAVLIGSVALIVCVLIASQGDRIAPDDGPVITVYGLGTRGFRPRTSSSGKARFPAAISSSRRPMPELDPRQGRVPALSAGSRTQRKRNRLFSRVHGQGIRQFERRARNGEDRFSGYRLNPERKRRVREVDKIEAVSRTCDRADQRRRRSWPPKPPRYFSHQAGRASSWK